MEVTISPVGILCGTLPAAQTAHVLAWARKRRQELLLDWQLARAGQPLHPIAR